MNDAIERLRSLLPQQVTSDKRLTKVEVLIEAADHLTQVQNLCAKLIAENNGLLKGAGGVVVMPGGGPVGEEVRRQVPNEPRRRGDGMNEEDEEEESEEEENEAEEDEYRRKDMTVQQPGRVPNKEAGPGDYAQMHHHGNRNGQGELLEEKTTHEGTVVSEVVDGGRSADPQLPLQPPPQPQQLQMAQHQEGDRP